MARQIVLDTSELDRIAAQLGANVQRVIASLAFDIEAGAKQAAPVDTSALRNSIYTNVAGNNGYSQASGAARGARPDVQTEPIPQPSGKIIATVGACVEYAEHVELGGSHSAAQPYLLPACEAVYRDLANGETWRSVVGEG